MKTINLSYYPDITQYRSQESIRTAVVKFSEHLSRAYSEISNEDTTIRVLPVQDVATQTRLMANPSNDCGIALMKPLSYILAKRRNDKLLAAGVAWREINGVENDEYLGQLFVNRNSGIKTIADITKKHRVAYGDSFSTSNFLIPAMELVKNGKHPFTSFRISSFVGGHDGTARAVYYNDADVGAGHDGAITLLAQNKGFEDANEVLQSIATTNIYSDPVVINTDIIEDHTVFTDALVAISEIPDVKQHLQDFWGNVTRIGKADPSRYQSIEDAINALGLTENHLL